MADTIRHTPQDDNGARAARLIALQDQTISAQADTILALQTLLRIAEHQRDEAQRRLRVRGL